MTLVVHALGIEFEDANAWGCLFIVSRGLFSLFNLLATAINRQINEMGGR